jgi:hypothetical protein
MNQSSVVFAGVPMAGGKKCDESGAWSAAQLPGAFFDTEFATAVRTKSREKPGPRTA